MRIEILFFLVAMFIILFVSWKQTGKNEISFYRQDIGLYFIPRKNYEKEKILFNQDLDFFFSLKNDSIALIQDIKKKIPQLIKEYTISTLIDSAYVKRNVGKGLFKKEIIYYRRLYPK